MTAQYNRIKMSAHITSQLNTEKGIILKIVAIRALGKTADSQGKVFDLNAETLSTLVENYNIRLKKEYEETIINKKRIPIARKAIEYLRGIRRDEFTINDIALGPSQMEHNIHNSFTVGRIIGLLTMGEWEGLPAIFANVLLTEESAIKKFDGGLLHQVSLCFDEQTMEVEELSFTTYGAVEGAQVIAVEDKNNGGFAYSKTHISMKRQELETIKLRLQEIDQEENDLKNTIKMAKVKKDNKIHVQNLIKCGKIYPKFGSFIENDLNSFSSTSDRDRALGMLELISPVIKQPKSKNLLAYRAQELLMSDELKKNVDDFYGQVKKNLTEDEQFKQDMLQFSKFKELKKEYGEAHAMELSAQNEPQTIQLTAEPKAEKTDDHDAEFKKRMKHHGDKGEFKQAYEEYSKFHGLQMSEEPSSTEVHQVPMSATPQTVDCETQKISESEAKIHELSNEKVEKLKQLGALIQSLGL